MSANKFIAELQRRRILSDRLMTRLHESLAGVNRPLSAEALAKFLVQKKHLTEQQAADVLGGLSQSGVNLTEEDAGDDAEDSSIFASHITSHKNAVPPPPDDDDEIRLAPIDDDLDTDRRTSKAEPTPDEDLPVLGVISPPEEPRPRRRAGPVVATPVVAGGVTEELEDIRAEGGAAEPETFDDATTSPRAKTTLSRGKKGAKKTTRPTKGKKQWDSPLILIGGGGLVFLLLCGSTIWWLLSRESGDQKLETAREAMKSGQYGPAIEQFQDFLTSSPRHPEHSLARVELAMLLIRQPAEAGDNSGALAAAERELKAVEDEDAFDKAQGERAALLPQIALGLAKQAEQADPTSEEAKKFVEQSNKALELCNNLTYIPKSLRDEGKLTIVRDTLQRVERRQQTHLALADGLKSIEQAVADGKPIESYTTHMKLLKEHPELTSDASLADAIKKTTAAEQAAIKFVAEAQAAETAERPTPWLAALAVANRRVKPTAAPAGAGSTACVRVEGAVYGLNSSTGQLLWRRHIGFGAAAWPILVDRDVIVADTVRHELMRLDAATGRLLWRQEIGQPFAQPLVAGNRGYVAADSGRLYVIDLATGARSGYLQFAQPIRVTPAIDRLKSHLYLPGDRASLYSISLADMKCIGVHYLGHAPSSIQVAPAAAMDKLAVVENDGVETSRLRLLAFDDKGAIAKQVADRRLNGLAASPPLATGRGLIVVTDCGQIEVYEIASGSSGEPLTVVATREATGSQPLVRYMAAVGRNIWLADTQLTKYSIVPTGNRLPVEEIEKNFAGATFDHPLAAFGDTLIHVHRPKNRAGYVVAATDTKQGHRLWETDLAMPPAGAPVVDEAAKSLTVASAAGYVFRFDEAAIRSRVQDTPLAAEQMPIDLPALTAAIDLGQGRAAFCAAGSDRLLIFNPAQGAGAKWLQLESPLACAVTPLGQGFLAPLKIGQVFYLSSADGSRLATPFQPRLEPQTSIEYKPAGAVGADGRQFVISDGRDKIYLVALAEQPQPHLEPVKEAGVGPYQVESPVVVLGDTALAVAGGTHLLRFKLPSLEPAADTTLPAPAEWGPYPAGDAVLIATVDQKLQAVAAAGEVRWQVPLEHGALAGPPLVLQDSVLLAYRKGIVERRALADGKPLAAKNVEQPLATGPVPFLQRVVLAAGDGTLLVIDQP